MKRSGYAVLIAVAMLLGILFALRNSGDAGEDATLPTSNTTGTQAGSGGDTIGTAVTPSPEPTATTGAAARPETRTAGTGDDGDGSDHSHLTDEFTVEDGKTANDPIYLDIGEYKVRVGEEFEVLIRLSAPTMENVVLYAEFDPTLLEGVAGSGKAVGKTFRTGIEFYTRVHKGVGQAVIINETRPGSRNLNPSRGEVVASFRMRALREGDAELSFPKEHVSFSTARGDERTDYEVRGGLVTILP